MKQKILIMLEMQDAMNSKVNPDWKQVNSEWYRAIWTECAEMLDHYGWKWWKHQEPELDQVKLELIDIFHFAMSDSIIKTDNTEACCEMIITGLENPTSEEVFSVAIETMAMHCIQNKSIEYAEFSNLMNLIDLDFDQLYRLYVGKNVLNFFRQDHGYKSGSYIKIWSGREDNEHLSEILSELDSDRDDFKDNVYQALLSRYPS